MFRVRDHLTDLSKTAADTLSIVIDSIMTIVSLIGAVGASLEIPLYGEIETGKAVWQTIGLTEPDPRG